MFLTCNIQCVFIAILTQEKRALVFLFNSNNSNLSFFFSCGVLHQIFIELMSTRRRKWDVFDEHEPKKKKRGQNSISLVFMKRFQNMGGSELPARAEMFGSSLAVLFMSPLYDEVFNITFFDLCLCLSENFSLWVLAISEVHLTLFESCVSESTSYSRSQVSISRLAMRYSKCVKAMSIFTPNLGIDWLACTMEALTEIFSLQCSPISFFLFLNLFWSQNHSRYYRLMSRAPIILKL